MGLVINKFLDWWLWRSPHFIRDRLFRSPLDTKILIQFWVGAKHGIFQRLSVKACLLLPSSFIMNIFLLTFILIQRKIRMMVNTIPPKAKYKPFLKTLVPGKNIQKEDRTKKNNDRPKNTLRKNNGLFELAL